MLRWALVVLVLAGPVQAQTDPRAVLADVQARAEAGADPGALAAELAPLLAGAPAQAGWADLFLWQADLVHLAQGPEAALVVLDAADAFFAGVAGLNPLYADAVAIRRGIRLADLGRLTEAMAVLAPRLAAVEALFGPEMRAEVESALAVWPAIALLADRNGAEAVLAAADAALVAGDLDRATGLARRLVVPPDATLGDPEGAVQAARALVVLLAVALAQGDAAQGWDIALQAAGHLTDPAWTGQDAPVLRADLAGDWAAVTVDRLLPLASAAQGAGQTEAAGALMAMARGLASDPAARERLLRAEATAALAAGDAARAVALSEERLALMEGRVPPGSDRMQQARFQVEFLRVLAVLLKGGTPDLTAARALVGDADSAHAAAIELGGLVEVAAGLGDARAVRDLAAEALALRDRAAGSLVLAEGARDRFLRDGRRLTEHWLNAAFDLARTEMRATPGAPIACAGPEAEAFCVILRID